MFFVAADTEDADGLAGFLRVMERDLGTADHFVGGTALLRVGAEAGPDLGLDFHLVDRHSLFHRVDDHGGNARRWLGGSRRFTSIRYRLAPRRATHSPGRHAIRDFSRSGEELRPRSRVPATHSAPGGW